MAIDCTLTFQRQKTLFSFPWNKYYRCLKTHLVRVCYSHHLDFEIQLSISNLSACVCHNWMFRACRYQLSCMFCVFSYCMCWVLTGFILFFELLPWIAWIMHVFKFGLRVFVCDCWCSPQQRVYKTQGSVSTHPVKTRLPPLTLLPHPKPQSPPHPQPLSHQQTLPYQSQALLWPAPHPQTFPRRMGSVHCWPWGTVGLRGARRRAWPHLLQDRLRLPWQRWNWRVCWTPQSFLLWVLRDGGAEGGKGGGWGVGSDP